MFELSLQCPQQRVEDISDALQALDAQSISVEDADALTESETALFGEPGMVPQHIGWRQSRMRALFASNALAGGALHLMRGAQLLDDCTVHGITPVPEQDWVRLTQTQFAPVAITPDFWVVPSWHEPPAQARHVIRLDPGLAFGTGTHPTTSMCLRWIATIGHAAPLGRVLDYGCGSGILGIAAALFGATSVDAVDIDMAAVEAAQANAHSNAVTLHCGTPDRVSGAYQTVLANILASPLKVLAPLLCARVSPGGSLVLAGTLERQATDLKAVYQPFARLECIASQDGWILMTARF
ncbi:MAG: 50S ribosomal protein L11 methyltransferase [Rhodoferax sp.]|nr:50S ribosomal protein L11 methyltransferase [Rhodoferax sp.]